MKNIIEDKINKKNKKFYLETYGCQMNEEDSEKLSGMLKEIDYITTNKKDDADIVILNTCCVRENAENKVLGKLGELKRLKKENPNIVIAICGCMMQQKGMADKILSKYPFVDIIFGTHNSYKFPEYLSRVIQEKIQIKEIKNQEEGIIEGIPVDRKSNIKAFVTVMYGCNNFCTYCIVPYVRGRERSREPKEIEKEIIDLISRGYKEITLLGQNVNSYGKGLNEEIDFADLLRRINKIDGLERIRFMTSHPKDISDNLINAIKECDKVCEQIHLPVQSGSNKILKDMNRHYTREQYLEIIRKIRNKIPGVSITTDIIIGFPGESDDDFNDTLELVKEVEYDSAFTFIYSRRNYTPADKMPNQIEDSIKHKRFNKLLEVINSNAILNNLAYEGQTVEVLVEGFSKNNDKTLNGRIRNGKLINFIGDESLIGKLVNVKVTKAKSFSLYGEVL